MPHLISPRSGAKKTAETAVDLTALAAILVVVVPILRARGWIPPEITGEQATAAGMAIGGIVARLVRHLMVYQRG